MKEVLVNAARMSFGTRASGFADKGQAKQSIRCKAVWYLAWQAARRLVTRRGLELSVERSPSEVATSRMRKNRQWQ
jgi:hypothetical protein